MALTVYLNSNKMACKKPKTSPEQYEILVQYIENHPHLKSNKLTNNFTAKDRSRLWEDLAECLNSVRGPHKDIQKWQKTWTDFKHITLKTAKMKRKLLESSGSFSLETFKEELSPLQRRVLNLIGWEETFNSLEESTYGKESLLFPPSPNEAFYPIIEEHGYSETNEQMYEECQMVDDTQTNIELFSITKYPDKESSHPERKEESAIINLLMQQQSEILEKITKQHKQILNLERKESEREKDSDSVKVLLKQQNNLLERIAIQLERLSNAEAVKRNEQNNSITILLTQQNKLLEELTNQQKHS